MQRHLNAIENHSDKFNLVAVCEENSKKLEDLELKKNVNRFTNFLKMIEEVKPDLVSVLVESGSHYHIVKQLIGKVGSIVVEKPFTLKLSHTDELIKMAKKVGTLLFVVKQNRFNLPVVAAVKALKSGRFGKLLIGTIRVRWSRDQSYYDQAKWRGTWWGDGGVITNQASHHLDLLIYFMGPIKRKCNFKTIYQI